MTFTMSPNNKVRKSLASEIDRLDRTLDGLADGLNEAVADAVKSAVGVAVKEAIQTVMKELLANPEVLAKLTPAASVCESKQDPSRASELVRRVWSGICGCVMAIRLACSSGVQKVQTKVGNGWSRTMERVKTVWSHIQVLGHLKHQIVLALGMGIISGIGVWYAEPWIGAVMSGIGGFATTLGVQAGLWLRRMMMHDDAQLV
jgi:hypothetical protein